MKALFIRFNIEIYCRCEISTHSHVVSNVINKMIKMRYVWKYEYTNIQIPCIYMFILSYVKLLFLIRLIKFQTPVVLILYVFVCVPLLPENNDQISPAPSKYFLVFPKMIVFRLPNSQNVIQLLPNSLK